MAVRDNIFFCYLSMNNIDDDTFFLLIRKCVLFFFINIFVYGLDIIPLDILFLLTKMRLMSSEVLKYVVHKCMRIKFHTDFCCCCCCGCK